MFAARNLILTGAPSSFVFSPTISSNTTNYNLKSAAISAGWDQVKKLKATVTINAGVTVYSTSTGTYAFDTGATFPTGSTLAVVNNGTILGCGGNGGSGKTWDGSNGNPGSAGGPALRVQYALTMTNNNRIAGGGGGGGGGGPSRCTPNASGGGGGGVGNGSGGSGYNSGSPGTLTGGGSGGSGDGLSAAGGAGGGYGSSGSNGNATPDNSGGAGGAAGGAIVGVSNITFAVTGTINGSQTG